MNSNFTSNKMECVYWKSIHAKKPCNKRRKRMLRVWNLEYTESAEHSYRTIFLNHQPMLLVIFRYTETLPSVARSMYIKNIHV